VLLEERTLLQSQVNFNQGAIMQLQKKLGEVASELSSSDCVLQNVHSNLRATKSRDTFISKLKLARCESMDREADAAQVQKEVNSWQEKDTVSLQQSIIELQQGYAEL
jgi:myosin protein heavy chain